jgi:hypothetical protein
MGHGGSARLKKETLDGHAAGDARSKHGQAMAWALAQENDWFALNGFVRPDSSPRTATHQQTLVTLSASVREKNFSELLIRFLLVIWMAVSCMSNSKFPGLLQLVFFVISNLLVGPGSKYAQSLIAGNASYSSSTFHRSAVFAVSEVR